MDPELLRYYNAELQYIRELGGEFARQYPKVAERLGMDTFEVADPYVERLLEGFAFLTARIQLKIDAEFPRFTGHLMEAVYPDYLAPIPSMAAVQLQPDMNQGDLAAGFTVPRHSVMRATTMGDDLLPCQYRTAQDVTLWPLTLAEAEYLPSAAALAALEVDVPGGRAGLKLRFNTVGGVPFCDLPLERLALFLRGSEDLPGILYEQLLGRAKRVILQGQGRHWSLSGQTLEAVGFADHQALLPPTPTTFQGYRLLREYFAFPQRYLQVALTGLADAVRGNEGESLDVIVVFDRLEQRLLDKVDAGRFALFCTPIINLFPMGGDRIAVGQREAEFHVVPDRTRPMDYEVHTVTSLTGYGEELSQVRDFAPFYTLHDGRDADGYFTVHRQPRRPSQRQRRRGVRSSYLGNEVFITLVDAREAPYGGDLRQLAPRLWCTNRDLPAHLLVGRQDSDFTLDISAPVAGIKCLAGPTAPRPSPARGEINWRLISHLSLNYLSLVNADGATPGSEEGATALRDILRLYADPNATAQRQQIDAVLAVTSRSVVRRMPLPGPISHGRGLEITVECDEQPFAGSGAFLLGAVLEVFFARYAGINAFTETVLKSRDRGEVMRWKARIGRRQRL